MYCYHCGKEIDINKSCSKKQNFVDLSNVKSDATDAYICPRCGHLVTANATKEDIKSLSQAVHAQLQRSRNHFASGMGLLSIGVILGVLAIMFFFLAKKASNKYVLNTNCAEFYVFVVLAVIGVILLSFGIYFVSRSLVVKKKYNSLLRDINNETFVQ